ncbi:hypothetical protein [Clostridium uliginosum]|uniref:Uncharacterized protein n=1 Tax=Clostridium uliginosum TaxID=119641 RepID=A0A1I1IQT2_9CLOT|nr:hypothetical protein [Clostridium uliginosum]SFC38291.1 hypothetical protein SAMN05421842_10336 [Clostridium uliginosum]
MAIKNRKRMKNAGMFYGNVLGIVWGIALKHVVLGIIIGNGIGGIIDIVYYTSHLKRNK